MTDGLAQQLAILTGRGNGRGFLEVRYRHPGGMRTRFYPAVGPHRALTALVARHAANTDVYLGCALREYERGDKAAVGESWVVWAECDSPAASTAAAAFAPRPTLVVASGSPGHTHAYWALEEPTVAATLEDVNQRLAAHLGADAACCDAGRILRPCGSRSHKHDPPMPVEAVDGTGCLYELEAISSNLSEVAGGRRRGEGESHRRFDDDPLSAISPQVYVPALVGEAIGPDGKVRCPLHADRTPSLHAYATSERGWYCYGACRRGGSIIDLAAALWLTGRDAREPRGQAFVDTRERLMRMFGLAA